MTDAHLLELAIPSATIPAAPQDSSPTDRQPRAFNRRRWVIILGGLLLPALILAVWQFVSTTGVEIGRAHVLNSSHWE